MCCDTNSSLGTAVCPLFWTPVLKRVSHVATTTSVADVMHSGWRIMYLHTFSASSAHLACRFSGWTSVPTCRRDWFTQCLNDSKTGWGCAASFSQFFLARATSVLRILLRVGPSKTSRISFSHVSIMIAGRLRFFFPAALGGMALRGLIRECTDQWFTHFPDRSNTGCTTSGGSATAPSLSQGRQSPRHPGASQVAARTVRRTGERLACSCTPQRAQLCLPTRCNRSHRARGGVGALRPLL